MKFKVPRLLRNKYLAAVLGFLLWICVFSDIDLFYIIKKRIELAEMRSEVSELKLQNEKAHQELHDLTTNLATLEKFAREKYYMKRKNEDVFVFRERAN